jgi:hypothetical protein
MPCAPCCPAACHPSHPVLAHLPKQGREGWGWLESPPLQALNPACLGPPACLPCHVHPCQPTCAGRIMSRDSPLIVHPCQCLCTYCRVQSKLPLLSACVSRTNLPTAAPPHLLFLPCRSSAPPRSTLRHAAPCFSPCGAVCCVCACPARLLRLVRSHPAPRRSSFVTHMHDGCCNDGAASNRVTFAGGLRHESTHDETLSVSSA